ncbi:MAG TPA: hypothetical protein VEW46_14375 [Pyrinomonadaceae bacterium]|nr:hypothetical protein [Pyrinomonadaceae bacterium]
MTSLNKALVPILLSILFIVPVTFSAVRGQPLAEGLWGGEHVRMEVTAAETKIEFDCGHATIASRILIDPRGRFLAKGTYVEERGGPSRQGEENHGYPAQFRGTVNGKNMKLTITRTDTNEVLGSFSLTHGREPELVKCR